MNSAVAFIPVRGGSKSIPGKNIKEIAGKPLVQWTVEAANNAQCIATVYVATDSDEIAEVVRRLQLPKVKVVGRSAVSATDEASTESALLEFCAEHRFDYLFLIQATSPLLTSADLDGAWKRFVAEGCESILSVVRQKRFLWTEDEVGTVTPQNYTPQDRPRRQDFSGHLVENGAFYLSSRDAILKSCCRVSGRIAAYEMAEESYYELDEPSDWDIISHLLRRRNVSPSKFEGKLLVMDCDGVMTDAGMYYSEAGEIMKKFNTRDGMAVEIVRKAGWITAMITGEGTPFAKRRAEKIGIDHVCLGIKDKATALKELCEKTGVSLKQVVYIGDDINDLSAMELAGLSACPADAAQKVKDFVDVVLSVNGGEGAVRELVEKVLGH